MSAVQGALVAFKRPNIKLSGNWATTNSAVSSNTTLTSVTVTITVPAASLGVLFLATSGNAISYSKNAATFVAITANASITLSIADGDTLRFRCTVSTANPGGLVNVLDNDTRSFLGFADFECTA